MLSLSTITGAIALIPGGGAAWSLALGAGRAFLACRPCLYVAAAIAIWIAADIHGHRAEGARCEARISADHAAAEKARVDRDRQIAADLERKYGPAISTLQQRAAALQKQVSDYAKKTPARPAACKLGVDALGLRPKPR